MTPMTVLISILLTLLGLVVGYYVRKTIAEAKIAGARGAAEQILEDAKRDAEALKKEALLEAKDEIHTLRIDAEQEVRERRNELQKQENRLLQKEENLDRKHEGIDKREAMLEKKDHSLNERQQHIEEMESKVDEMIRMQQSELERISSLTRDEAKQIILDRVENELSHDIAIMTKETENRAKEEADKKAKNILSLALQRCAADHVAETTVSVVNLPNDEMKGRIIGREGRNIRTLETLTGIDLIIDDTPEAVILSGFDPIRRETARIALDKLVQDGRIHPARIEEMVEKSRREVDDYIREMGEQTTFEVGVHGLHPDLIKILGRLKFRTSYGQNVLKHSMEVAFLAGLMASELGEDAKLAKRAVFCMTSEKQLTMKWKEATWKSEWSLRPNIKSIQSSLTVLRHTTETKSRLPLSPFWSLPLMHCQPQDRAREVKRSKTISADLKSLKKSPSLTKVLKNHLRFRPAVKFASW